MSRVYHKRLHQQPLPGCVPRSIPVDPCNRAPDDTPGRASHRILVLHETTLPQLLYTSCVLSVLVNFRRNGCTSIDTTVAGFIVVPLGIPHIVGRPERRYCRKTFPSLIAVIFIPPRFIVSRSCLLISAQIEAETPEFRASRLPHGKATTAD